MTNPVHECQNRFAPQHPRSAWEPTAPPLAVAVGVLGLIICLAMMGIVALLGALL